MHVIQAFLVGVLSSLVLVAILIFLSLALAEEGETGPALPCSVFLKEEGRVR